MTNEKTEEYIEGFLSGLALGLIIGFIIAKSIEKKPSGITASTGAAVAVTGPPLAIFTLNPEETGGQNWIYFTPPKPIVIKPSSGFTIQQYAVAGVGLFNATIYFSTEAIRP